MFEPGEFSWKLGLKTANGIHTNERKMVQLSYIVRDCGIYLCKK